MKGGGGISWNLMMGLTTGGVTIHMVDSGIDTGDILMQSNYSLPVDCANLEASHIVSCQNKSLLISFLDKVLSGYTFIRKKQTFDIGSYWPRLKTDLHGYLNWSWEVFEILSFIRAFSHPFKGAATYIKGKKVRILSAYVQNSEYSFHPFQYGLIYRVVSSKLYVACKGGTLVVEEILYDDASTINLSSLLGHRLITPSDILEQALSQRIYLKPS